MNRRDFLTTPALYPPSLRARPRRASPPCSMARPWGDGASRKAPSRLSMLMTAISSGIWPRSSPPGFASTSSMRISISDASSSSKAGPTEESTSTPRSTAATPGSGCRLRFSISRTRSRSSNSMGAIFPLVAPSKVNVRNKGEWNDLRILMDWPHLRVWVNGEVVQDLDVESVPELRYRLRRGYLGLSTLSYPIRFRNLRIRELPDKEIWEHLYETDPISRSGSSRRATPEIPSSSSLSTAFYEATAWAISPPRRSTATSSSTFTSAPPKATMAAFCSAPTAKAWQVPVTTRFNYTTSRKRTSPPAPCTTSNAPSTPASSPRGGT